MEESVTFAMMHLTRAFAVNHIKDMDLKETSDREPIYRNDPKFLDR